MAAAIGHRLFTVLLRHADASERRYTNQPVAYPVGGRKPVTPSEWTERVFVRRQPYIGRDAADIGAARRQRGGLGARIEGRLLDKDLRHLTPR